MRRQRALNAGRPVKSTPAADEVWFFQGMAVCIKTNTGNYKLDGAELISKDKAYQTRNV